MDLSAPRWARFALALAIGALGGALANWLNLPLAWMIGSMTATTLAAAAGAPLAMPRPLRHVMVAVLGVMLGSGFTPEILPQLSEWGVSLFVLVIYSAAAAAAGTVYFRRWAGYDRTTAFFAAMPGGLSEMILVGGAMGGDARIISLTHAARILFVVTTLPIAFQILLGYEPAAREALAAGSGLLDGLSLKEGALLLGCGVVGFLVAHLLKLPAAAIIGPMAASAALHLAGISEAKPPDLLVSIAQVVIGTSVGCRFAGVTARVIGRALAFAAGSTVILLAISMVFALLVHGLTRLPLAGLVMAYAPGGLAEMSLIALVLSIETAFVATHHMLRIFLIVVLAPTLFRRLGWQDRAAPNDPP
ncbi:MAG: AbrB family transcriptional regulator [Pseudomonadota bacterium]